MFFLFTNSFSQNAITPVYPINKSIVFNSTIEIRWNSFINNQTRLFVSTDSTFNSTIYSSPLTINSIDTVTLQSSGNYYWQVVSFNLNNLPIDSSKVFKFTYTDIFALQGLNLFFISDSGITINTNNQITNWTNLVDAPNSAYQNTPSVSPLFIDSVQFINNSPVVRLDGVDDLLLLDSSLTISEMFSIFNWRGNNPNAFAKSSAGLFTGQQLTASYLIGTAGSASTDLSSQFFTFKVNERVGNDFSPLSNYKLVHGKRAIPFTISNMQMGRNRIIPTHWNGDIAALLSFSQPLSDSLRNIVNKYLCQKYSNTLSLGPDIQVSSGFCDTLVQVDTNFTSYRWSNGDTTSASFLTPGNTYQLTVVNNFGCSYTDEIYVSTPLKPEIDLTLCLGESYVWDTELSKNEYSFLWSNTTTDSLLSISQPGDYYVRVTDANNCFLDSDTITVSYDSTLANISLGPDTSLCLGYDIGLTTIPAGISSYLWNTNQTSPRIVPQASGVYWVDITSGECIVRDSINITIKGDAPTANFTAPNICFGDSAIFIDNSQNPTLGIINKWRWNFGNGLTDTTQNTSTYYSSAQSYSVSLYVETDANCSDSITKQLLVNPKPIAGFTNSLACVGDSIFFTDTSKVSSGGLSRFNWKFNDPTQPADSSASRNPSFIFNTAKNYPVRLIVESGLGCKDTTFKNLKINGIPVPDYSVVGNCLSDSTYFTNQTQLPAGDQLASINWNFGNNTNANIQNPTIYYSIAKFYLVQLDVTTDKGCSATIKRQFEMNDKPVANFSTSEFCLDNFGKVTDLSTVRRTTINQWNYQLQQAQYTDSSNLQNPSFQLNRLGDFNLTQIVTSAKNCKDTSSQNIPVRDNPNAFFNLETYLGAIPFAIKFDTVTPSNNYNWSFGNGDSAFVIKPSYAYTDTGNYTINLVIENQFGCIDSMHRMITANTPNLNLFLDTITVDQSNNQVRVGVVLINTGNNEINSVRMLANLNSSYRLEETWRGQLFPNDFIYTEFTSSVVLSGNQTNDFTCVEILAVNDISDLDLLKNEICVKGTTNRLFLKAFPNPTTQDLFVEMVVPAKGNIVARVYDNMGKEQAYLFGESREKGFYRFTVPSAEFMNGMYYLIVDYKGAKYKLPFIKQ